jgi:CDP-glycerol glycerophosphotransferase (TagB/SpsB family)
MQFVFLIISPAVHVLSLIVPKRQALWCFGAWFGQKYADNSRYLFEAAAAAPRLDAVWISARRDIVEQLRAQGFKVFYAYSLAGVWCQMRAGTFVCTVNSKDFYFATLTLRSRIVQLWHGSPLKRIGFDAKQPVVKRLLAWLRSISTDRYSHVVSPAPLFDSVLMSAFDIRTQNLVRCGYPRNDGLFISEERRQLIRTRFGVEAGGAFVLYLPTHRDEGRSCDVIATTIEGLKKHEPELAEKRTVVVVKPHFYDVPLIHAYHGTNVQVVHDLGFDLYEVLGATDGLVTDYSSVFFDYEILGKPIYFHAPDMAWYRDQGRGMYFGFDTFVREYSTDADALVEAMGGPSHLRGSIELNCDREGCYSRKLLAALGGCDD